MTSAKQIYLGSRRGPALPYDAEVEYLDNDGLTQYIDTGLYLGAGTTIDADFTPMQMANDRWAFGSFDTNARRYAIYQYRTGTPGGYLGYGYGMYGAGNNSTAISVGQKINLTVVYTENEEILKFNGVEVGSYARNTDTGTVTRTAYLFGLHRADSNIVAFRCRFGRVSVSQNNVLVRDFQPVRFMNELGQSEGAMYDRVSDQLFRNAGTGAFVFGTDIAGGGYKCLGYSPLWFSRFSRLWKEAA